MYDKSRVMKLAWVWARQDLWSARADKSLLHNYFAKALKRAWVDVKNTQELKDIALKHLSKQRTKEEVLDDIRVFESKDTIRGDDWKVLDELRRELVYAK
jgi:hypothetical protein